MEDEEEVCKGGMAGYWDESRGGGGWRRGGVRGGWVYIGKRVRLTKKILNPVTDRFLVFIPKSKPNPTCYLLKPPNRAGSGRLVRVGFIGFSLQPNFKLKFSNSHFPKNKFF